MSNTFLVLKIDKLSSTELANEVPTQLTDNVGLGISEGIAYTYVRRHSNYTDAVIGPVDIYDCRHDYKKNVYGRVFEKEFKYYFEEYYFLSYHITSSNLLIIPINKTAAASFKRKLIQKRMMTFSNIKIDYNKIISNSHNVTGVWQSVAQAAVTSRAVFGDDIADEEEVQEAIKSGDTNYVTSYFPYLNDQIHCGITKNANITFHSHSRKMSIEEKIKAIQYIYDRII